MADTSLAGESATLLAGLGVPLHLQDATRKRAMRRFLAGAGVVVFHILFLILLVTSEWFPVDVKEQIERRPLLWILLPQASRTPKVIPVKPLKSTQGQAASTYVKPDLVRPHEEENNAINLGLALGRSLACGANSYEYLTLRQRLNCHYQPWQFVYDRYGNVVLYANQRPPEETEKLRPSDVQAHERNTAPSCPKNADPNAPCIGDIIHGH